MKVKELMAEEVVTCRPSDSLERATRIMWERDCGCVPVVGERGELLAMITDRDVAMACYTTGGDLRSLTADRAMTREPRACGPEDDVEDALHAMSDRQLHRLPVVDPEGRPVGILSLADVVQAAGRSTNRSRDRWARQVLATMVEVTRPRVPSRATEPGELVPPRPPEQRPQVRA